MQDSTRSTAADRERASVQGSNGAATGRSRRRWSAEEKARVVRESLRPGERVGEVARRYGISRWQLSTWRSLAREGKLAAARIKFPDLNSCSACPVSLLRPTAVLFSPELRDGLQRLAHVVPGRGVVHDAQPQRQGAVEKRR